MRLAIDETVSRLRGGIARAAIDTTVSLAHRSAVFREWLLNRLSSNLDRIYEETTPDDELIQLQLWFGRSLKPFLRRMVAERPRAARALVRLTYVWSRDCKRRSAIQGTGTVTPCTVVLEPTGRCNLNCPGCYAKSGRKGDELPYDLLKSVVEQVRDMGVSLVTLSGGEPFIREREDRAITRLAADFQDLGFLVYTNSLLIDEATVKKLGEVGNVFPAISIEGGESESDARRGRGYYKSTRHIREALAEHEVMFGFSATATSRNAELLASEEFIDKRIEEGDMFGWYFLLQPIGRNPAVSLLTTPEQRAHLREQLHLFRAEGKPIFIGDFWNDGLFVGGCIAAGRYYFHIYDNGDISPCVFSPLACENIKDIISGRSAYKSLSDFVNNHPFFKRFRDKQHLITDHRAPCVLFDHPEMIRDVCAEGGWYPTKNMPEGYLDGEIARAMDANAEAWQKKLQELPMIPECVARELCVKNGKAEG